MPLVIRRFVVGGGGVGDEGDMVPVVSFDVCEDWEA